MAADFAELAVIGRRLTEPLTGVGRYLECLLRHWRGAQIPFESIRVYVPGEPQLPADSVGGRISIQVVPQRISPLYWENVQLPRRLRHASLIFAPYTLPWFQAARGVVSNLGIYDSRPGDFSLTAQLRTAPFFRRSVHSAIRVIANSQSTKRDLTDYYGAVPASIDVVPLGADERLSPAPSTGPARLPEELRRRYGLPDAPYFLLAGKLSRRRNIPLLIQAFAKARSSGIGSHRMVIIGPDYIGLKPLALARAAGVLDFVSHIGFAPMADLAHFYRGAAAYTLPTEHEGFSLTIPEAMACGTPAIVFDHASLEGPLRDAAWITPRSPEALAAAMETIATNPSKRAELRARSLAAAQHYRWESTARRTMEILEEAASQLTQDV